MDKIYLTIKNTNKHHKNFIYQIFHFKIFA